MLAVVASTLPCRAVPWRAVLWGTGWGVITGDHGSGATRLLLLASWLSKAVGRGAGVENTTCARPGHTQGSR